MLGIGFRGNKLNKECNQGRKLHTDDGKHYAALPLHDIFQSYISQCISLDVRV